MKAEPTSIPGVFLVHTTPFNDHRGSLTRLFCEREIAPVFGSRRIVQINHTRTRIVGAVRGFHYQHPPHTEMKLIRCLRGRVWDVAVDLRAGSPTFLHWHPEELTPGNARMMVIPEGCAHGFQALEPDSELLYLHTAAFTPGAEGGVAHDDPSLSVAWPLTVTDLSDRDCRHPHLDDTFQGLAH